jgi:hypothetical protein
VDDDRDREDEDAQATDDVAREKEAEHGTADEEGVHEESTSQERLDRVAKPEKPGTGAPYPPKPA